MATTQKKNPQNDFQQFAQNMRRTSLGIRFARLIFGPGNKSLANPRGAAFITATMKELGFPIPDGVQVTVEIAQLLASGEAAYTAYNNYQSIENVRSVTDPSAQTVKGVVFLGDRLGWWDQDSETAQMIRVGADVAMIIGSMGSDWKAWAALAFDIAVISGGAQARAQQLAHQGVATYMQNLLRPQQLRAAELVKEFQESANATGPRLTTFGFVAQVAAESPDLWLQLFPQFASWGIDYQTYVTINTEKRTWYGDAQTAHAEHYWRTVRGYSKEQLRNLVFQKLAWPVIFPFAMANRAYVNRGKGSLYSLALLSMLTGLSRVEGDVSKYLDVAQLTPSDLGDTFLHDYIVGKQAPNTVVKQAGIYVGQQAVYSKAEAQKTADARFVYDNRDFLDQLEQSGRIDLIRRVPELSKVLSKGYTFEPIPFDPTNGEWNEVRRFTDRGGQTSEMLTGQGAAWRQIRNYFSALAIVDQLRSDSFYADWFKGELTGYAEAINFIASADQFDADYRRLQMTSMIRGINTMALGQIAYYMGTTPDKLVKVNQDGVTAFVKKG